MEPAGGEIADGLEVILEGGIPVLRGLRQKRRVVDGEGGAVAEIGVGLVGGLAGHELAEAGAAEARGPAQARLEIRGDVVPRVDAGKRLGVFAVHGAAVVGVVGLRGGDGRGLGGRGRGAAEAAGAHEAVGLVLGFLPAHAADEAGAPEPAVAAELALRHRVRSGDGLDGVAVGGVARGLAEIEILAPNCRVDDLAAADEPRRLPLRNTAARLALLGREEVGIVRERAGAGVAPAARGAAHADVLLAPVHAGLGENRRGNRQRVADVEAALAHLVDLLVVLVGEAVGGRAVVGGVGEIGAAVGQEAGKQIRLRAIEDPAGAGEAVGEHGALAVADVDVRLGAAEVRLDLQRAFLVLEADIDAAEPVEEIVWSRHRDIDHGGGDGAHGGDAVRVAGRDAGASVGGGVKRGIEDDLIGGGADVVLAAVDLGVVDVGGEERDLGRGREAVVGLGGDVFLPAMVVEIAREVAEEEGGRGGGVLEIAGGEKRPDGGLAVEERDGDAEVAGAAERVEDLLVAEVGEAVEAALLADGNLLRERRRKSAGERVGDAALLAHRERRTALEIDRAAEGIGALVGRMTLDELHLVEHRAGDVVHEDRATEATLAGHEAAIHRDLVKAGGHAADREAAQVAACVELAIDAGQADGDLAGVHVREVAERIGGGDVLQVVGIPIRGDGGGVALALAGDLEGVELVDAGREIEVAHGALADGGGDNGARGVEADVGDNELMRAGGHAGEGVEAGVVGQRAEPERRDFHARALEQVAGREVGDVARDRGVGVSRAHQREREREEQGRGAQEPGDAGKWARAGGVHGVG